MRVQCAIHIELIRLYNKLKEDKLNISCKKHTMNVCRMHIREACASLEHKRSAIKLNGFMQTFVSVEHIISRMYVHVEL